MSQLYSNLKYGIFIIKYSYELPIMVKIDKLVPKICKLYLILRWGEKYFWKK